eukprot:TRINITY_DN440_c0_g2_i1.p1 TRINITY_DN440_c0_g2~~TRINITY_DN440_c0_g2_i1.p1  ORF type:complete len:452 (-),score=94.25 TRINITY_DN440_c0_g2_i1:136-1491(-)
MKSRIFLLALLVAFASCIPLLENEKSWIAFEGADEQSLYKLMRTIDVRDTFQGVTLAVATSAESMLIAAMAPTTEYLQDYDPSRFVYIVDLTQAKSQDVDRIADVINKVSGRVMYSTLTLMIFDVERMEHSSKIEDVLPAGVDLIPVARSRVSPPALSDDSPIYSKLRNLEKSEVIQRLIDQISNEKLYSVLDHLSNQYTTRNALSAGAVEAQEWIARLYASLGYSVTIQPFFTGFSPNVIAELRGSVEPEKYVVIGAHYDCRMSNTYDNTSRAPGADDDGSGTTAVLEIARVLVESGIRFRYSIRIASWGGEEQGLLGSTAYVKELKSKNVNVVAYLNADMLGFKIPRKAITLGMKGPYTTTWLNNLVNSITAKYFPTLPIASSSSCCSDYKPFYENGYPASGFFENDEGASSYPCYHNVCDTISEVNMEQLTLFTRAMIASTATIAEPV